jgi:hypothetical protein
MRNNIDFLIKALLSYIIHKALPVGTRRKRKDGIYEKQPNGKWLKITEGKKEEDKRQTKEVEPLNNPDEAGYTNRPSNFESKEMGELSKNISETLDIPEENIYIHSTLSEGMSSLLQGNTEEYLSTSTLNGSTEFINKFSEEEGTSFFILNSQPDNLDFYAYGDVGSKGMSPKKTSYDEAGLTSWDVAGIAVPPNFKNNRNAIATAVITQEIIWKLTKGEKNLSIFGADSSLLNEVEEEIEEFWEENEHMDGWDIRKALYEKYNY